MRRTHLPTALIAVTLAGAFGLSGCSVDVKRVEAPQTLAQGCAAYNEAIDERATDKISPDLEGAAALSAESLLMVDIYQEATQTVTNPELKPKVDAFLSAMQEYLAVLEAADFDEAQIGSTPEDEEKITSIITELETTEQEISDMCL